MKDQATVLIVDDEKHTRDGLRMSLEDAFDVYVASDRGEAMEVLRSEGVDVMVTDLRLGGEDGMELIDEALKIREATGMSIMMTAYGSVDTAVEAMKRGAYHFVTKPLNIDELEILIKRALHSRNLETENKQLRKQVEGRYSAENILGKSGAIRKVLETIEQVAPSKATVLIEGRERDRERTRGARDSRDERAAEIEARHRSLCGSFQGPPRERVIRSRTRRVHGREPTEDRPVRGSGRGDARAGRGGRDRHEHPG